MPENYPEIEDEVENATTRGVVVVAAAGNGPIHAHAQGQSDCDLTYPPAEVYPAMYADVIAVSGTEIWLGEEQFKSGGSGYNYGSFVDVAAPAVDIWIAGPSSGSDPNCALTTSYALKSGTSFGAPMVAALASLLLHYEPDSSVIDIITSTAEKIASSQHAYDANGYNNWLGFGRINAYQALLSCHPTAPTGFSVTGGTGYHPTISWDLNDEDDVDGYKVYRKYGSGSWSVAADVSETTDEWEDTEVTLSTGKFDPLVCYKVTAYDLQSHESEASSSVCKRFDELSKFTKDSGKADVKDIKYLDLDRPFPNPFNSSVELRFQIPEDDYAQIVILDINARKVKTFSQNGYGFTSGQYSLLWDGTEDSGINMPSGVYFINLVGRKNVIVSKILLIK